MSSGLEVFNNKVVLITGTASGLGKGMATLMAANGATVVGADIDADGAQATADAITAAGGTAEAHRLDVTDSEAVTAWIDDAAERLGRIDYMFNNAGIAVNGPVEEIPVKNWDDIIDINLKGMVYGTIAAYRHMRRQRSGHIVNTASLAGLIPSPWLAPYSTTKFAVVGMSESLRIESKAYGVDVTALCPGFIDSRIFENARYSGGLDAEQGRRQIPLIVGLDQGVKVLLQGVAKKKRIVTLPAYGHVFWWSYRLTPGIYMASNRMALWRMRRAAKKSVYVKHS